MNKRVSATTIILFVVTLFAALFFAANLPAQSPSDVDYSLSKMREKERKEQRKYLSALKSPDPKPVVTPDSQTGEKSDADLSSAALAKEEDDDAISLATSEDNSNINQSALELILLLDSSRSMLRTDPQRLRDQGAKLLLNFLDRDDKIGIYRFDSEVKQIVPLQPISRLDLQKVEAQIRAIPADGNFTDLELAISSVLKSFSKNSKNTQAVVLLSDGEMDPKPSRGSKQELTKQLLEQVLPVYRKQRIKLYTIAFSPESDERLLEEIAGKTKGVSWFAPTVDTLHLKFSDLFLTMKRPQLAEIANSKINVDAGIDEITFYIVHPGGDESSIRLIDPAEDEIGSANIPFGFRWFKGTQFDLVTVKNPLVGTWRIEGLKDTKNSFATLITDLKIQANAPNGPFKQGDRPIITARFLQNGKMLLSEDMLKGVIFFSYKLINAGNGEVVAEGDLNDLGEDGDAVSKDGIYSATLDLTKSGRFRCVVIANAPTFSRQQILNFDVQGSLIQLSKQEIDGVDTFSISLNKEAMSLKNPKVVLFVRKADSQKIYPYPLEPSKTDKSLYKIAQDEVITSRGNFLVYAKIKGLAGEDQVEDISNIVAINLPLQETPPPAIQEEDITAEIKDTEKDTTPPEKTTPQHQEEDASKHMEIDLKLFAFAFLAFSAVSLFAAILIITFYSFRTSGKSGFFKPTFSLDLDKLAEQFPITEEMVRQTPSDTEQKIVTLLNKLKGSEPPPQTTAEPTEEKAAEDSTKDSTVEPAVEKENWVLEDEKKVTEESTSEEKGKTGSEVREDIDSSKLAPLPHNPNDEEPTEEGSAPAQEADKTSDKTADNKDKEL